jgi:S-DNA-T family DNA segregation ATPase FtsK/SpoIIIE
MAIRPQEVNIKPLGLLGWLAFPVAIALARKRGRQLLKYRLELRQKAIETRRAHQWQAKRLQPEGDNYAKIIQTTLARLDMYHRPTSEHDGIEARERPKKVQYVQFEKMLITPEVAYFKLRTRRMGLFQYKNALPYGVRVLDIINDQTLEELSYACHRKVGMIDRDYRRGVWLCVYRTQAYDRLPELVTFLEVQEHYPTAKIDKLPLILGVGEDRVVHQVFLDDHPHVLVAGASGGGKSNMINNWLCQIIRYCDPKNVELRLVDLKNTEFPWYEDAPHVASVITEAEAALELFHDLMDEIKRRQALMKKRARKLSEWNQIQGVEHLPRIVCVIDEFAELMVGYGSKFGKEIEGICSRITSVGRSAGVHLIACTQRPAVDTIPNSMKVNMDLIVSAPVQNADQSRVIVGSAAAAELPNVPGRMLAIVQRNAIQLQTPLVTNDNVVMSVRIARGKAEGVIKFDHILQKIEVLPEGLDRWLLVNRAGRLRFARELLELGISQSMFSAYASQRVAARLAQKRAESFYLNQAATPIEPELAPVQESPGVEVPKPVYFVPPDHWLVEPSTVFLLPEKAGGLPDIQAVEPSTVEATLEPVEASTDASNTIKRFLFERCSLKETGQTKSSVLYAQFCGWCSQKSISAFEQRDFVNQLKEAGYTLAKRRDANYWLKIEVKQ